MSAPMKNHHTEVLIDGQTYIVPFDKKKPLMVLLMALGAQKSQKNIPSKILLAPVYKNLSKGAIHLKAARAKEGLSQNDLMKATGIAVSNISKMENGSRPIGKEVAKKLAKSLKISFKLLVEK